MYIPSFTSNVSGGSHNNLTEFRSNSFLFINFVSSLSYICYILPPTLSTNQIHIKKTKNKARLPKSKIMQRGICSFGRGIEKQKKATRGNEKGKKKEKEPRFAGAVNRESKNRCDRRSASSTIDLNCYHPPRHHCYRSSSPGLGHPCYRRCTSVSSLRNRLRRLSASGEHLLWLCGTLSCQRRSPG